ncbi:MAG: TlyA family RNA methyltransferase [Chthoniobacterales bacterium]|nr:TlyA family RNA methyltransferase [Chthoniobacterales bacterium]
MRWTRYAASQSFDATMAKKSRLDLVLVERGFFASREQAQRALMAGEIRIGDRICDKASQLVERDAEFVITGPAQFVGRGGVKLAGALDQLALDVQGKVALDIGASTGGFTDCLLQRGAAKVYAVDVGHGQLAWKIRNDPRVVVREKLNARYLSRLDVPDDIQICVIDVSFISLTLVLPNAFELSTPDGVILALIKPQFELRPEDVGRGGIVSDSGLHEKAQAKIRDFVLAAGHAVERIVPSVITGADGNQEFFLCARKRLA